MSASKILIVEDEPNMVAGLRDNFEYEGFQVLTALDGVEGLERALKESPDLIGLELGADDYVTKPFSIRELLARVKAVLRRAQTVPKEQDGYTFGDVEVNLRSYQVFRDGKPVDFSGKEFDLLKHFLCHSGETLSR